MELFQHFKAHPHCLFFNIKTLKIYTLIVWTIFQMIFQKIRVKTPMIMCTWSRTDVLFVQDLSVIYLNQNHFMPF
jgi:hypothetical protein